MTNPTLTDRPVAPRDADPPHMDERLVLPFETVAAGTDRLVAELVRCRDEIEQIREELATRLEAHERGRAASGDDPDSELEAILAARAALQRDVLDPVRSAWRRQQPFRRALRAVDRFEARLRRAVDAAPAEARITSAELLAWLDDSGISRSWWSPVVRLRRAPRAVPARRALRRETARRLRRHERLEDAYFRHLAECALDLLTDWNAAADGRAPEVDRTPAKRAEGELPDLVGRWHDWARASRNRFGRRLVAALVWRPADGEPLRWGETRNLDWAVVPRTLESEWDGDEAIIRAERAMFESAAAAARDLAAESASVAGSLQAATAQLREGGGGDDGSEWLQAPDLRTHITPSAHRLARLESAIRDAIERVPAQEMVIASLPKRPRPGFRFREANPRETLWEAFERRTIPGFEQVLGRVESRHAGVLRQISEAGDVLSFAGEVATDAGERKVLLAEARANALATLESAAEELGASDVDDVARALADALAAGLAEGRVLLGRDRVGAWRYVTQQGLRRGSLLTVRIVGSLARRAGSAGSVALQRIAHAALARIGWSPADEADRQEVTVRAYLPREFTAKAGQGRLPPLYERLFRLEPLEDERLLVGRDRELAALAEARELWSGGRPVAAIVVGERGSGKTSLMNCALDGVLAGCDAVRGQFGSRITTEEELRRFLADLLDVDDPDRLEAALAENRRLIVIEELERTFLRHIGHFGAVRALQRLIAKTSDTTLWVLVTNQIAFRLLNASTELGQTFSHRLNAATIGRDDLRRAILVRQKLSGLRVKYPEPVRESGAAGRLRRLAGARADPETAFFDALAEESNGVFRTALTLWRHHIDRIEGGVLTLHPIVPPDLSALTGALDLDDLFSLVAVSQHGSLTVREHAVVFQRPAEWSRAQLDGLLNRELIEADPDQDGFRVRPQALRAVRDALYRRNLL